MTPTLPPIAKQTSPTMAHHASASATLSKLNASRGATKAGEAIDLNAAKHGTFRAAMSAATASKAQAAESPEDAKLRATAEQLVNQLFMGTMLKQMRSSPFKDSTMSGGKAGDAYAGLFDQNLASKAGGGMGKGLVDVMVKHLKKSRDAVAAPTLDARA